jgi:RNA polymerase sigma factor (TIGR02999 family)
MSEITLVLQAMGRGDSRASEELLPLVYDELRRHAAARMAREAAGQTLQPTALVHEAWMRLVGDGDRTWQNRAHFFGAAAEAMRRILIENARRKSRLKHGGDQVRLDLDQIELAATTPDEKILLIDEALEKLRTQDPEKAPGCDRAHDRAPLGLCQDLVISEHSRPTMIHWCSKSTGRWRVLPPDGA